MKPTGVQVCALDGTITGWRAAPPAESIDVRLEEGWYHVTAFTAEGNSGTFRYLPVVAYPVESVRWVRKVWTHEDSDLPIEHFLEELA